MTEAAPTTQAEQEDALETNLRRIAELGYTVRGQRDPASYMVEAAEIIATLRAKNDQLAADLRKAREALPETLNTGNLVHDVRTLRMAHDSMHRHAYRWGRAALLLLPFVDMAAGEGLEWAEQEGVSPRMDAAELCVAFAEAMGCELGDAAYTAMMTEGEAAIAALNATPDPKDAGGTAKGEDHA